MSKINRTPRDPPVSGFYTERAFRSLEERDNRGTFHFVDQRVPYRLTLTNQQFVQTASYRAVYFFSKKKKDISEREESVYLLGRPTCLSEINFRNKYSIPRAGKDYGYIGDCVCAKLELANQIAGCDILKCYFASV